MKSFKDFESFSNEEIVLETNILPKEIHPKKWVKAYKLFRYKNNKLYPLFVKANKEVPIGKWLEAEVGDLTNDGKVKSSLGKLAYRPGWHSGSFPMATHIGGKSSKAIKKPEFRPNDQVWAEVLVQADVNWQEEANKRATRNKQGKIVPKTAQITDRLPDGGYYRYKTNANMTGEWLISGAIKVNKILTPNEVKKINTKYGVEDLPAEDEFFMSHPDNRIGKK